MLAVIARSVVDHFAPTGAKKRELPIRGAEKAREGPSQPDQRGGNLKDLPPVITKVYRGAQEAANAAFQADATKLAAQGYFPTSQSWAPGTYGCGAFLAALLLCFVLIGFLVFVYLLIVKPDGALSVTYELRSAPAVATPPAEKTCPKCAERVKAAAQICRFCHYEFASDAPASTQPKAAQ